MKKIYLLIILSLLLQLVSPVFAQSITQGILPSGFTETYQSCDDIKANEAAYKETVRRISDEESFKDSVPKTSFFNKQEYLQFILGCALKWGKIKLFMIPFYITFFIQFLLSVAGLVAVLFLVIGGYHYVIGGLIEEKEKGKNTIKNALLGLIVALSAWIVVNFIQVALTS